jgi:hypothetical protein
VLPPSGFEIGGRVNSVKVPSVTEKLNESIPVVKEGGTLGTPCKIRENQVCYLSFRVPNTTSSFIAEPSMIVSIMVTLCPEIDNAVAEPAEK